MSELPFTPTELRQRAQQIRQSAQYAQGRTRQDELDEARALERKADLLERHASKQNEA